MTLVSSSMLTKTSDFIEKRTEFGTFLKIELYASYIHQNEAKTSLKLIPWQKNMICLKK